MTRMRRALPRIALTWLLCHAATLTVATTVLWPGHAEGLLECTCAHGDHTYCPMHHKPAPGSKLCLMQSANDTSSAVLSSLFGALGLVATSPQSVALQAERGIGIIDSTTPSLRPAPPDPPPPRA